MDSGEQWGRIWTSVFGMQLPDVRFDQGGLFRTDQAAISKDVLDRLVRVDVLTRVREGVYGERALLDGLGPREVHLLVVRADLLALPAGWRAGRRSAALAHDLPLIGTRPPLRSQLLLPRGVARTRPVDRHHRICELPADQRAEIDGVPVTSLARTAVDIARQESFRNGVCAVDGVLGRGLPVAELDRVLAGMKRWPGAARARQAVRFGDGLSESLLESLSRVGIHELGLPAPELQVEIWVDHRFVARVDKLWRAYNTVGEDDGLAKFGDDEVSREDSFRLTKHRQDWLEDLGFEVPRWGWTEAWRPQGVLDRRVLRAFERGAHKHLDPRVRFVPTTVADRLARERRRAA